MPSAGEVLQTEREVQGRTLTDIAAATHIKTDYLAALEADKYDTIPGAVFVKGFIRSYANYLGINGEELIDLYLQHTTPERPQPVRRKVRKSSFCGVRKIIGVIRADGLKSALSAWSFVLLQPLYGRSCNETDG